MVAPRHYRCESNQQSAPDASLLPGALRYSAASNDVVLGGAASDGIAHGGIASGGAAPRVPELLAPAGGMEQLQAAVRYGADAVYLATDRFGMRARATNFSMDELPHAVAFAHSAGVRVYVTCNILMGSQDIDQLPAYYAALQDCGVDAAIVGDLGAARLLTEYAPKVALHVSTQASVANAAAARVWHDLGARRVVCAREMSLCEIARMRADTPPDLEIEAFVHGAQCMAVSGRCLISSYLTGRSGNKGNCTQPCRWNYALEEEKRPGEFFSVEEDARGTFIMNAKDLNMLAHVRELAAAGVSSLKIEGRNKKAFYVATVVNAYRRVLDGVDCAQVAPELETVSHRPYSTGFYFGEAEQAPDYYGYEQTCLHVADVLSCAPAESVAEESTGLSGDVPQDNATPDNATPAGVPQDNAKLESASSCEAANARASWLVEARCRNRFAEGDELEVLIPSADALSVVVRNISWLPEPEPDSDVAAGVDVGAGVGADATPDPAPVPDLAPIPVPVANRSSARYRFTVYADEIKGVLHQTSETLPGCAIASLESEGTLPKDESVLPKGEGEITLLKDENVLPKGEGALPPRAAGADAPFGAGCFLRSRQFRRSARH